MLQPRASNSSVVQRERFELHQSGQLGQSLIGHPRLLQLERLQFGQLTHGGQPGVGHPRARQVEPADVGQSCQQFQALVALVPSDREEVFAIGVGLAFDRRAKLFQLAAGRLLFAPALAVSPVSQPSLEISRGVSRWGAWRNGRALAAGSFAGGAAAERGAWPYAVDVEIDRQTISAISAIRFMVAPRPCIP